MTKKSKARLNRVLNSIPDNMIDPLTVLICTPSHAGKVETSYAGGLASCASAHLFGNMAFLNNNSHVSLARDTMADGFLRSPFEWMVFIDDDIGFTERDFRILMDYPVNDVPPMDDSYASKDEKGRVLISCAEYSRKDEQNTPARFGLGFTRIHRKVFEALDALTFDNGEERVRQYRHQGRMLRDYFISGAMTDGNFLGEDTGFFSLVRLAGITPRIEQRTRLIHTGRKQYAYVAPTIAAVTQ